MRAWQVSTTKGGLEKHMQLNSSAPLPRRKNNQHLVQVIASALNPVDYKPIETPFFLGLVVKKPATPGLDFVGRMVEPAAGSSLKRGQLVCGAATAISMFAGGTLADYTLCTTEGVIALPDNVEPKFGATIGIAGLTAYQTIEPYIHGKGASVFLNGGSGGVGVFAIQIAKAMGCYVATTCSTANVDMCKQLGADLVIDYKKQNVVSALVASGKKFDHIVDNVGSDSEIYFKAHLYSVPSATFVEIAGEPTLRFITMAIKMALWPGFLGGGKRKLKNLVAAIKTETYEQLGVLMGEGKIKPVIDSEFAFTDAPKAFEKLKTHRAKGKIIVHVNAAELR